MTNALLLDGEAKLHRQIAALQEELAGALIRWDEEGTRANNLQTEVERLENIITDIYGRFAPIGDRPCDCDHCTCGNASDAYMVAQWDAAKDFADSLLPSVVPA
jgi:hypothetical protein